MTTGEETQPRTFRAAMPLRYRLVLGVLGFTGAAGCVLAVAEGGRAGLITGAAVAGLFLAVIMITVRLHVGEDSLRIRVAGVFSTEVPYREMTAVSRGPVTGMRYGMGLRILPDGTGYLVGGPSVLIECRTGNVLVSCSHPDQLLAALAPRLSANQAAKFRRRRS
ncbi:hypothetical protein MUG94_16660 [Arthrobacter gengyunqii]|uniref:Uncharacterized protein n=1 Tax=Arthrobacter gengyunqii TaxID=2886940 RepID=A0A9X1M042_9MICC|nr:hypothetical protein [Arthrobacter gengyunqii]MCC3268746.1 hypothetical protein [Arthrobacter gengyunqii]UOY96130.1 hypothetical protein MUG94_16660 [Arthrobacter gengyunqii]